MGLLHADNTMKTAHLQDNREVKMQTVTGKGYPSGFIHYDGGVSCGPKHPYKKDFLTGVLSTSAAVVFFEGLYRRIP